LPTLLLSVGLLAVAYRSDAADDVRDQGVERAYRVHYLAKPLPSQGIVRVTMSVEGPKANLPSRITLHTDPARHRGLEGDGTVERDGDRDVVWKLPADGGKLAWDFVVDRRRGKSAWDARMTADWAVLRLDHLVPALSSTAPRGAQSTCDLRLDLPAGWSAYSGYGAIGRASVAVGDPERRLGRPRGWAIFGDIASRSDQVAGVEVRVASPAGAGVHHQDVLTFIAWTLPTLVAIFKDAPEHLLVVSAPDPFWRGALSGPHSMFVHADRPLVSENRTSTMVHELVHVLSGLHGDHESDWFVEGLAEYYSVEILHRTGAISRTRYLETIRDLVEWGSDAPSVLVERSSGATTARAVGVLVAADRQIRKISSGEASLDDLARELARMPGDVTLARIQKVAERLAGAPVAALAREALGSPARP
jgi:hypothetical protein